MHQIRFHPVLFVIQKILRLQDSSPTTASWMPHSTSVCNSASQLSLPEIAVLPSPTSSHTLPRLYLHASFFHYLDLPFPPLLQPLQREADEEGYRERERENKKPKRKRVFYCKRRNVLRTGKDEIKSKGREGLLMHTLLLVISLTQHWSCSLSSRLHVLNHHRQIQLQKLVLPFLMKTKCECWAMND